jgi:LPS O-antigen subunit length determinant protein (WzzB/FepE family)
MSQIQNDEVDLFMLFKNLWDGKWLISTFVALAVLTASFFLHKTETVYETKFAFYFKSYVPSNVPLVDFKTKLYSKVVFEEWKRNVGNTSVLFEDFSRTEFINGFLFSKRQEVLNQQLVNVDSEKKRGVKINYLIVKTNNLPLIFDIFKYTKHVSTLLNNDYVVLAKREQQQYKKILNNNIKLDVKMIEKMSRLENFISSSSKLDLIRFDQPHFPRKVSPRSARIIAISIILGFIIGILFVIIRSVIINRNEKLIKN